MKYYTQDELIHFEYGESCISEIMQMNGCFYLILDNVIILPENSCNRDIRKMRTNDLTLKITEGRIRSFIEEGYKIYDADGRFKKQYEDTEVEPTSYIEVLKSLSGSSIYSIQRSGESVSGKELCSYEISIDGEDHTYSIVVEGVHDTEEWNHFFSLNE